MRERKPQLSVVEQESDSGSSLAAYDLHKVFAGPRSRKDSGVHAVNGVSLQIRKGRTVALVGQSGSGKTTLGRIFAGLETATSGTVTLDGQPLTRSGAQQRRAFHQRVQPVFQDPYGSLDPRKTILDSVSEPLRYAGRRKHGVREAAYVALERVGLRPADLYAARHPHSLSGGQRQRVAIARAIATEPDFIIADEPVSMLDVSLQAGVLNLFAALQRDLGCGYLFITHDLAVARYVADTIAVMYRGQIVEQGPRDQIIDTPQHEYTKLLLNVGRGQPAELDPPITPDPTAQLSGSKEEP